MAVYDKSGYSHSETSLVAVIYMSSQVRPPQMHPHCIQAPASPVWPAGEGGLPYLQPPVTPATFPPGQNRDFSG